MKWNRFKDENWQFCVFHLSSENKLRKRNQIRTHTTKIPYVQLLLLKSTKWMLAKREKIILLWIFFLLATFQTDAISLFKFLGFSILTF